MSFSKTNMELSDTQEVIHIENTLKSEETC